MTNKKRREGLIICR